MYNQPHMSSVFYYHRSIPTGTYIAGTKQVFRPCHRDTGRCDFSLPSFNFSAFLSLPNASPVPRYPSLLPYRIGL